MEIFNPTGSCYKMLDENEIDMQIHCTIYFVRNSIKNSIVKLSNLYFLILEYFFATYSCESGLKKRKKNGLLKSNSWTGKRKIRYLLFVR